MVDPPRPSDSRRPDSRPHRIHVLLVEDDDAEAIRLTRLMEKSGGFSVERVDDVEQALARLDLGDHDVVLHDLGPPGGDGLEGLTRLVSAGARAPVITLLPAGSAAEDGRDEALSLGARDCLPRCDAAEELLLPRVLRHAVERQKLALELELARRHAQELATRDPLTGLPNRMELHDQLARAIAAAQRNSERLAVLVLGLDRFKHINESQGHAVGDELLCKVGARLVRTLRESDLTARHGGDQFAAVLEKPTSDHAPGKVAEKILASLAAPMLLAAGEFWLTASIGIAVFPRDGDAAETLLRNAETAMYRTKLAGGAGYRFYDQPMNETSSHRLNLERRLRKAFADGVIQVYYQPKVDLRTGGIVGAEALLRWRDPDLGHVPPAKFIPVAEETGLIDALGEWALSEACTQTRTWQREGFPSLSIAVNISAHEVREHLLREKVARALWKSGLEAGYLDLEITESTLMHPEMVGVLRELKGLGLGVSLDDFGTGFSSLSHLKAAPVDTLKIDRSFVRDLVLDPHDEAIVSAILSLAGKLGLTVVAEGVETEQQRAFLSSRGCDQMQGFLLSPALPPGQFVDLLRRGPGRA